MMGKRRRSLPDSSGAQASSGGAGADQVASLHAAASMAARQGVTVAVMATPQMALPTAVPVAHMQVAGHMPVATPVSVAAPMPMAASMTAQVANGSAEATVAEATVAEATVAEATVAEATVAEATVAEAVVADAAVEAAPPGGAPFEESRRDATAMEVAALPAADAAGGEAAPTGPEGAPPSEMALETAVADVGGMTAPMEV